MGALLVEVAAQADRLAAVRSRLTAAHDRSLAWKADGARSQKQWLTDRCRLAPGTAGRQSRDARHLAQLPRTAEAFAQGAITAAQAAAAAAVRDLPADALEGLDRLVADQAPDWTPPASSPSPNAAPSPCATKAASAAERPWPGARPTTSDTWIDGGPTDLNNLILVCWRCHRDIHHTGR